MNVLPAGAKFSHRGGPVGFPQASALALSDRRAAPKLMSTWRDAWRRQLHGHGQAHIACYGDSVTAGGNSSPMWSEGWVYKLAGLMNAATGQQAGTGIVPFHTSDASTLGDDTRLVETGTWTNAIGVGYFGRCRYSITSGSTIEFGPVDCEAFRVYYLKAPSGNAGVVDLSIDGGSTTRIDGVTTSTYSVDSVLVRADAFGPHTLRVDYVSGVAMMLGVEAIANPQRGVKVSMLAVGGSTAADLVVNTNGNSSLTCCLSAAPDLAIITLGTNDSFSNQPGERAFENSLHTAIDRFTAIGSSVMLGVAVPMTNVEWRQYADAVRRVAAMRGTGIVDLDAVYQSRGSRVALYQDHIHQTNAGHTFIASLVADAVLASVTTAN